MTETGGFFGGGDTSNSSALGSLACLESSRVGALRDLLAVVDGSCFIADGATNLTTRLRRQAGMVKPEARRTVRRVNILRRLPAFAEHLWAGRTTMGHLDVLAEVASHRRQEALDVFGRLTADQATVVGDAFDRLTGPDPCDAPVQRTLRQRRADALAELAASFLGGRGVAESGGGTKTAAPRRAASSATVVVGLPDLTRVSQTYASSASGDSQGAPIDLIAIRRELLGGGVLPALVAEHLTCDAQIRRLIVDPAGNPLNLGRSTAAVSQSQRDTLAVRDRGCVFPTCDRPPAWCDSHHLQHWAHGGPTDLDNLVLLCRHHHRLVHGPDWDLRREPDLGRVIATRRAGRTYERDGPNAPPCAAGFDGDPPSG